MKYFGLVLTGLRRKWIRTLLTGASIFVAFLLLGVMSGVTAGFDDALDVLSDARLRVISRANILEPLPVAYLQRIEAVEGVDRVSPVAIFPAYYQEQFNNVSVGAMDIDSLLDVFPEIRLSPDEVAILQRTRTGATAGKALADRFGWQIGDQIPLQSYFLSHEDGGQTWVFDLVSIHNDGPDDPELLAGELYFHFDYLNESRATQKDTVNMFMASIDDPEMAGTIAKRIDDMFANSMDETQTMNEKQFMTNRVRQLGDVQSFTTAIQLAVLFTLLFIAGSTMWQSARERIAEFGVLKAIGFSDNSVFFLVIVESFVLCLLAAVLGLGFAALVFPSIFAAMGLGGVGLSNSVWLVGFGVAVLLAVLVALAPAVQLRRLPVADAMRRE